MTMNEPTVRSVHNEAMRHSMDAYVLYSRRQSLTDDEFDTMIGHYHHAFELESRAATMVVDHVPDDYDKRQPTERILRRSAMSCLHTALSAMDERWNKEPRNDDE